MALVSTEVALGTVALVESGAASAAIGALLPSAGEVATAVGPTLLNLAAQQAIKRAPNVRAFFTDVTRGVGKRDDGNPFSRAFRGKGKRLGSARKGGNKRQRITENGLGEDIDTMADAPAADMYMLDVDNTQGVVQFRKRVFQPNIIIDNGNIFVQVAFIQRIHFKVESSTSYDLHAFVPVDPTIADTPTNNELNRNILAQASQEVKTSGAWNPNHDVTVNRILPFGFLDIHTSSSSGDNFSCVIFYQPVRVTPLEFWNMVQTDYTIDLDAWFPLTALTAHPGSWNVKLITAS